jgi:hypothetical protein
VAVRIKHARRTLSVRYTRLHKRCRYRAAVTFARTPPLPLRVSARYFGNRLLRPLSSRVARVR